MGIESDQAHGILEKLRTIVNALPEVSERPSHSTPTFFIRDKKVLASLWEDHHDTEGIYIWCPAPPGVQEELVERESDRFFRPAYVGHRGWIGMHLTVDPDWDEVTEILKEAYRLVAPKTLAAKLDQA
jgi:hypothetical protein